MLRIKCRCGCDADLYFLCTPLLKYVDVRSMTKVASAEIRCTIAFVPFTFTALLSACSSMPSPSRASPLVAARGELSHSGILRAAINFGNPILATRDATTGWSRGVSVELARELGRCLGTPVELVTYTVAGRVVAGIKTGARNIAFFAIDPVRMVDADFSDD